MPVSIKDIAREANVSYATVSRALTGQPGVRGTTREHVMHIAFKMGYIPNAAARRLVSRRTATIGVIVTTVLDYFYAELFQTIAEVAIEHGYRVWLASAGANMERELAEVQALRQERIDGLIIISAQRAEEYLPDLESQGMPVVVVNKGKERRWSYSIETNSFGGGKSAVEHLIQLGHTRVAYIAGPLSDWDETQRRGGFLKAMSDHALDVNHQWIIQGNGFTDGGQDAFRRLFSAAETPTAIFCYNDATALGVLNVAFARGIKVPEQLSIVGFDDINMASYTVPPLTTIRQHKSSMGRKAVEMILSLLNGQDPPKEVIFNGELIVRHSTAPPLCS